MVVDADNQGVIFANNHQESRKQTSGVDTPEALTNFQRQDTSSIKYTAETNYCWTVGKVSNYALATSWQGVERNDPLRGNPIYIAELRLS